MISHGKDLPRPALAALHVHSHFSLLSGVESLDWLVRWARRAGYGAVALADVNGMYGAIPFYQSAKAAGIKPILGVELRVEEFPTDSADYADYSRKGKSLKSAESVGKPHRLTLLARTGEGYRNLCRLTSLRQLEPQRFNLVEDVAAHSAGLFVLCDQPDLLKPLARVLPAGSLYAELSPVRSPGSAGSEGSRARLRQLYAAAAEAGVPVVAALDSYFAGEGGIANCKLQIANCKLEEKSSARLAATRSRVAAEGSASPDSRTGQEIPYLLHRIVTDIRLGAASAGRAPREQDYQPADRFHWPADDLRGFFARCPEALANANRIAEQCEDDIVQLGVFHFPASRVPPGETGFSHLHKLCARGLRRRYRPVRPEAVTRLAYELSVIDKMHLADYFLFVNEIVAFARGSRGGEGGIPLDVRGSAAGSLVAYVLGFTQVCPIAHDLYFERFLHEGRTDCPDIDIDLCWRRRDEVIDFCYRRFGPDHVAMICTHSTMRARGAFVEVGKVLGLTAQQAFALSRHIPEGIAGYLQRDWRELAEARRNLPLDDPHFRRVLELAARLEGAPRHLGIHCGGLVISPGPLTDYLPLQRATKGIVVTQYEMNAVEAIGLVKMDLLGNRALSEVAEAGRWITADAGTPGRRDAGTKEEIANCELEEEETPPARLAATRSRVAAEGSASGKEENAKGKMQNAKWQMGTPQARRSITNLQFAICDLQFPDFLDNLDPQDPATAKLLSSGDTLGVFQAESPGMRNLCRQIRVASREDLTVALSVIRPGPAASGMKAAYVARHLGLEAAPPHYLHPKLASLIGRTHGVLVYQEDTMRVAVGIAGFTPGEADMLRKAVSKKRSPERMEALRQQFIDKALRHTADLSAGAAGELWEQIAHFASYSFCRAHACVYGRIAWQTAWLKAHAPVAFYTAVFNNHMGMYPMRVHVADAIRHGVRVLGPDVNGSESDCILESSSRERELAGESKGCDGLVHPICPRASARGSEFEIRNSKFEIRLGLRFVRSLSGGGIERIIAGRGSRRDRPYRTLDDLRRSTHLSEPELINLIRCGACDGLGAGSHRGVMLAEAALESPVGELLMGVECATRPLVEDVSLAPSEYTGGSPGGPRCIHRGLMSCLPPDLLPRGEGEPSRFPWAREFTELEKLQAEIDVLGLFLSHHPMELVGGDWTAADRLADRVGQRVVVAGVLDATRTVATSRGELMRFVTLEDQAGVVECTFFPEAYQKFGHLFYHLGPFRVAGVVESDRGAVTVTAESAESLVDASPLKLPQELYPPSQIV